MTKAICDDASSRSEQRRRRITDAARTLFIANGFHATGVAELARLSGVAVGQIYRDFQSKEEIVAALAESNCARLMRYESLEAAIRDGDAVAVRRWLRDFVTPDDNRDDARLFAEIVAEAARNARVAAIVNTLHDQLREHVLAALELLAPDVALANRRATLTEVLMTLSLGLSQYLFMAGATDTAPVLQAFEQMVDGELDRLVA